MIDEPTKEEIAEAAALLEDLMSVSGEIAVDANRSLAIILKNDRADREKYYVKARVYGAIAHRFREALDSLVGNIEDIRIRDEAFAWRHSENTGVPSSAIDEMDRVLAAADALEVATKDWVREENRAVDLAAAAERLIDSLPKCTQQAWDEEKQLEFPCPNPATRAYARGSERFCDDCADREYTMASAMDENWKPVPEYPRAAPLRALIAKLAEESHANRSGGKMLAFLLLRIGSWTTSRFDQHLRYEFGDEDADHFLRWLAGIVDIKAEGEKVVGA